MASRRSDSSTHARGHFLGAVVVKQQQSTAGDPARFTVIDGQQRLTTLQILIDAVQIVLERTGCTEAAESLQELLLNAGTRFQGTPRRFKLWPSRVDRAAFEAVMDNSRAVPPELSDSRIAQAHAFFDGSVSEWAGTGNADPAVRAKLDTLAETVQRHLQIVAIHLDHSDDDQLIFETLNDRGTPLLAADLIKNHVFQRCEDLGGNVDALSESYWLDFDDDWWRAQVAQGRLYRSRIDLFLQYWLTMRERDEVQVDEVFSTFRSHADAHLSTNENAESLLRVLRRDADTFRELADLDPTSAEGSFYSRVVEALELGAFIPVVLWLLRDSHRAAPEHAGRAFRALESWAVRRTLLRRTMKDVNKLVVALLRELERHPPEAVGDATVRFLRDQSADSRAWPTNEEILETLPAVRLYGNLKQNRLRVVLSAIESSLRTARHEVVTLPSRLEIEHVMPQGWRHYWASEGIVDERAAAERDQLVSTIGNLTLVTQKLNVTLSNRPWTDAEAATVAPTGRDAGLGKRALLGRYSLLVLNKSLVDDHLTAWTNADIVRRGREMASAVVEIWQRD